MDRNKTPFSTKILIWIAKKYVNKITAVYQKKFNDKLPIILIAGTAGKSSSTILIKQLFKNDGWDVYSGASKTACLNSLSGLIMVLSGSNYSFEKKSAFFEKIKFVFNSIFRLLFQRYDLIKKTILVYEVGFNEQNESRYFTEVFGQKVEDLIITNLTYEHSEGFDTEFDSESYSKIKKYLPEFLSKIFDSSDIDGVLKNIALEQFKLARTANNFIFPSSIGVVDNNILSNFSGKWVIDKVDVKRSNGFSLLVNNKYKFSEDYLLPITFGKYIFALSLIRDKYNLKLASLDKSISNPDLPNGRFGVLSGINNSTIIDSSYNSDPASVNGFLGLFGDVIDSFKNWNSFLDKNKDNKNKYDYVNPPKHYLVLGEMRELGDISKKEHSIVLDSIIDQGKKRGDYIQEIFLLGKEWFKCDESKLAKSDGDIRFVTYRNQIFKVFSRVGDINNLLNTDTVRPNSWFWIKGSQNTIFLESLVKHLLMNPDKDSAKLCRVGDDWDAIRSKWE